MGSLTEATFTEQVDKGCSACGGKKLLIRAYVEGKFPLLAGEPGGAVAWAYKGETFVDGVFEIRCAACKHALFTDPMCPRCHAADGLAHALDTENAQPVPEKCPTCSRETLAFRAFVPVSVAYEGKRADKARSSCTLYDAGFRGVGAECIHCGLLEPRAAGCPLCEAPAPIRPQPR